MARKSSCGVSLTTATSMAMKVQSRFPRNEGKLFTFDAPTNVAHLTGLSMDLQSSRDILFELSEAEK